MEEDPQAPGPSVNKLYFPAAVFFGKVHALPGPEEVEFPERDLADKLVSVVTFSLIEVKFKLEPREGRSLLFPISFPHARHRQAIFHAVIYECHGQHTQSRRRSFRDTVPLPVIRRIRLCR